MAHVEALAEQTPRPAALAAQVLGKVTLYEALLETRPQSSALNW